MLELRWYQEECVQSFFDYWNNGNYGNPLAALPTATGKSIVIAEFCRRALTWYPQTRILALTHVKELIEQNYQKLKMLWPQAPAGIYSAGLNRRQTNQSIIFGGVQSVYKAVEAFGKIDLVCIDEAHLVSPDDETRYQQIIAHLRKVNPYLKVFGLTATWWRKKQGALTNDGLFTDICYNRTTPADFQRFVAEGYLAPLVTRATRTKLDLSSVGMSNGDYNLKQLEAAVDQESVTVAALRESLNHAHDRRAWLVFCSGIDHAAHVAEVLNKWGIRTGVVHSKMPAGERDAAIDGLRNGTLRALTNNNVLTTGIDIPHIDFCIMLRPTLSSSLWVQMLGRLMRPAPGKHDGLVLDFAGNTARLGPVDDPEIPGRPRPGGAGDAPVKICDYCGQYNYTSVRFCAGCGAEFPIVEKLSSQASDAPLMTSVSPIIEEFRVTSVNYADYYSKKDNRTLRVTYHCGLRTFHEYISIGGTGYPLRIAHEWWKQRHYDEPPETIEDALLKTSQLRVPTGLRVWINKQYPEILGHIWH